MNVELRGRGIRAMERAHDEHVQEVNWRSDWCLSGVASDIATRVAVYVVRGGKFGGVMMASKFAAGVFRFGTVARARETFLSELPTSSSTFTSVQTTILSIYSETP